jgi:5-methylthioadenosine/S-adenosylhomocysteine deaminase
MATSPSVPASRREFLTATAAAALAAASCAPAQTGGARAVNPSPPQNIVGDGRKRRILLRGGVVLTLDQKIGDFENADVLIDGARIVEVRPGITAADAEVVDCAGTIVMPGFITTHHHQYETLQRSIIADGVLAGAWPQETYASVVQNIWTAGRVADPRSPGRVIWDLGRVPYDPEDCYIAELVACVSEISQGITTGTDTSQANHTPDHTDAMIKGLKDSGRRMVYAYSAGTDRSADGFPFEFPGAMNDTTKGIGRIARTHFASRDQLVTLGFAGGPGPASGGASYTGWQLGRSFGASMHNHVVGNPQGIVDAAADARNGTDWSDVTFIHATRWQDAARAQVGAGNSSYPTTRSRAWEICRDRGAHISIAGLIEMQMRHGMPPFQEALNHGILPSLSPDVDTNMTTDPFSLMRGAFCLQRALANDLAFPESNPGGLPTPQLVTSRQVIEMATIAGAASNRVLDKVGTLTPGKEADIIVLEARHIDTWPMNNVPGTIVTMMNPTHVRDVLIAGKVVYWKRQLVGFDLARLLSQVEQSRDRVLARINGRAKVGALPRGDNSSSNPYRPNMLGSCCFTGQNPGAPEYVLRP